MQYFLSDEEIQKIFKLNKAYIDAAKTTYDQSITSEPGKSFFEAMDLDIQYKTRIASLEQGIYGSISKLDDTLYVMPYGLSNNGTEFIDALKMIYPIGTDFYGISTPLKATMGRMYAMIHYAMQNILLTEPYISKISIIGHSYGGVISQVLGVLVYKIILYHSGAMSAAGKANMDRMYSEYIVPSLNEFVSTNARTPIIDELNQRLITSPGASFADNIKSIDHKIFTKVQLDMCLGIGTIQSLDISILDDPDLGLRGSMAAFESGNRIAGDFFSKMYTLGAVNDEFFNIVDPRTVVGFGGKIVNSFRDRIIIGQIIVPSQNYWWDSYSHCYFTYTNLFYYNYLNHIDLPVYSYRTLPNNNPLPLTRLNYFALGIFLGSPSVTSLGMLIVCTLIGVVSEIVLPAFLIYLGVKFALSSLFHIII